MDQTCGVTAEVEAEVERRMLPIEMWLEQGIVSWIYQVSGPAFQNR
jgi:hypothetical protein